MNKGAIIRRTLGACVALTAFVAGAPASALASGCTAPTLTQPFLSFGDSNWYTIAPGQKYDSFTGQGWILTGGAKIVATTLYDRTNGYVLDLPAGSRAVSPAMCVTNDYPTARSMVRNVSGTAGVNLFVSYLGLTWGPLESGGTLSTTKTGWALSGVANIHPSSLIGWQLAQFTFVPSGYRSEYQLYNYYVDPKMH